MGKGRREGKWEECKVGIDDVRKEDRERGKEGGREFTESPAILPAQRSTDH